MKPRVRIGVVNFNGGEMTLRCLDTLAALQWPADRLEVVLVDNASTDGIADRVETERPTVRVVRNASNLGFTGGANVVLREHHDVDYVALVNNDAVVAEEWLEHLIGALEADPGAAAANGKVLFAPVFAPVVVRSGTWRAGPGDRRQLGVRVSGVRVDGRDVASVSLFPSGFYGLETGPNPEPAFRWSDGAGHVLLACDRDAKPPETVEIRMAAERRKPVTVEIDRSAEEIEVDTEPRWFRLPRPEQWLDVVNSAGSVLLADGSGRDRGFEQIDDGRFATSAEVFGWTGSAVVLRAAHLAGVGVFDERLFLYYEDFDLSWRARLAGWRHLFVSDAVAWHHHSATTDRVSPLVLQHLERNRLVVLTKLAPARLVGNALGGFAATTAAEFAKDLAGAVRMRTVPRFPTLRQRLSFFGEWLRLLPGTLVRRREARRGAVVDDAEVLAWVGRE